MNIKKSLPELEEYFGLECNSPETINSEAMRAALIIATTCAHPADLTTEDLEKIALPLERLAEIMGIIDKYEDGEGA